MKDKFVVLVGLVAALLIVLSACAPGYLPSPSAPYEASSSSPYVAAPAVYVIAPSVSTSMEARRVLHRQGWRETGQLRDAQSVLVVVRSMLYWPLSSSYRTIQDLDSAARGQLNISGSYFHVYLYSLNHDYGVYQADHVSYPAH